MCKKIIISKSFNQIKQLVNLCDGYIVGIKNLSVNLPNYFSIDELKEIETFCVNNNKSLFVSINKNIHNSQLAELKETLIKLSNMNISGVIFYDIAIVNLNNKLNLNLNLIWNQEHMVTNFNTINYWSNKGISCSYLSSELTKEEVFKIRSMTKCKLMMNVFGYIPMFTSKRPLVKNYLEKFNLFDNSSINYLEKENNLYPIVSSDITTVYSSKILNLSQDIKELEDERINYLVFNSFNIEDNIFLEIMNLFNLLTSDNIKDTFNKINMLLNYNIDTGFFYKETVYKVKKNG